MGLEIPEPPKYSFIANSIISAYNTIARSRRYEQGVPLALDASAITTYMDMFELPCELHIFFDCIMSIDNKFIDKVHKQVKQKARKSA